MHGAMPDFAVSFQGDGVDIRETEWQGMNVALERFPAGMSTAPIFVGLPDDRCQCPHWGYVVKGQVTFNYADRDEVYSAGDAYYAPPGHTTQFNEDTEVVEFSPRGIYQETMEVAGRNAAAMMGA